MGSTLSCSLSGNADGFRASIHSIQNMVGDRDFSSSRLLGMRSTGVADDTFVAADLSVGQSASIVSASVSWQRPLLVEERSQGHPDVVPRQPHRDRRHHKRHHPGTRQQSLIEQRRDLRAVVDVTTGQHASDNLAETASKPICNLCHERRFVVPCFSTSHSPGPFGFSPVLSTINCRGPA